MICPECNGSGNDPHAPFPVDCEVCGGNQEVQP
jgi:DnaJ-class molecular chaperone